MRKRIVALMLAAAVALTALPLAASAASNRTGVVIGGWLNLRSAPSFEARIIRQYNTGTVVTILGDAGSWYYVQCPDGREGYMLAKFIDTSGGGGKQPGTTAYVTSPNGKPVHLRTGPSTVYEVIADFWPGTQCTIIATTSDGRWCNISINGYVGYMMSVYLTGTTPTPAPSGKNVWVTAANGRNVNLRSGPGKNYRVIGSYAVGTRATIIEYGQTWCRIYIGTRTGYMMTEFLTEAEPSPDYPILGATMVISPNGRPVRLRNGPSTNYQVIGSYPVGTKLTVIMRGQVWYYIRINGRYGYMMRQFIYEDGTPQPVPGEEIPLTSCLLDNMTPTAGQTLKATVYPLGAKVTYAWYYNDSTKLGSTSDTYQTTDADIGKQIYCVATAITGSGYIGNVVSATTAPVAKQSTTPTDIV